MSKSAIYTVNSITNTPAVGTAVPVGTTVRRFGCAIRANGTVVSINEPGYYAVDVSADFASAAAGDVSFIVTQDGAPVIGAIATETIALANTQFRNAKLTAMVRVYCGSGSNVSVLVDDSSTTAPTITNLSVRVIKL